MIQNIFPKKTQKTGVVFIVEDDQVYARALENYIKINVPSVKEVFYFRVGETCIAELKRNPDLIIMDYMLNSKYDDAQTGVETIDEIRTILPDARIVVLSGQNDIEVALDIVNRQQCQYLVKDDKSFGKIKEILQAI